MTKPISGGPTPGIFNYDTHKTEISSRFGRLIKQLGPNNKKGSTRYNFEVEFAYAINELEHCPRYLQGKMYDALTGIVSSLIAHLRSRETEAEQAPA